MDLRKETKLSSPSESVTTWWSNLFYICPSTENKRRKNFKDKHSVQATDVLSFQETDDTIQGNRDGSLWQRSANNFNYLYKQGGKLNQMIWTRSKCTSKWFM